MNKIIYEELITFHPGYYIKDMIEEMGMSQDELAKRLNTTGKNVSGLINGKINLTEEMALRLSIVFGTSIELWLNLNKTYIEKKIGIEKRILEDEQCNIVKHIDYSFWTKMKLVIETKKSREKVRELSKYLKISQLSILVSRDFLVQYKKAVTDVKDVNVINANAWVQTAINIGRNMDVKKFDPKKLSLHLQEIREMTVQSIEKSLPRLQEIMADCGVALVVLPNLKNCGINGAVKWLSSDKVILALNDRRKYADTFWFSLFHEIGHVFQKRVKLLIVSDKNQDWLEEDDLMEKLEEDADSFAQNILIPEDEYFQFISKSRFNENSILVFSRNINIHPGIVLGRLQRDGYVSYKSDLNSLKQKYSVIN